MAHCHCQRPTLRPSAGPSSFPLVAPAAMQRRTRNLPLRVRPAVTAAVAVADARPPRAGAVPAPAPLRCDRTRRAGHGLLGRRLLPRIPDVTRRLSLLQKEGTKPHIRKLCGRGLESVVCPDYHNDVGVPEPQGAQLQCKPCRRPPLLDVAPPVVVHPRSTAKRRGEDSFEMRTDGAVSAAVYDSTALVRW